MTQSDKTLIDKILLLDVEDFIKLEGYIDGILAGKSKAKTKSDCCVVEALGSEKKTTRRIKNV